MRREFDLPEEDVEHLNSLTHHWETIAGGWLIIYDQPVPLGYTISKANIALKIDTSYPRTQIDMAYFSPPLIRQDRKVINALSMQTIDGKPFQRWSRHRTVNNPWRVGIDCIGTHIAQIEVWLQKEFTKP